MPEMRGETEREAKRKGIARPDVTTREHEPQPEIDPTGAETQPDPATREEHLRSDGRPKTGATGGPG